MPESKFKEYAAIEHGIFKEKYEELIRKRFPHAEKSVAQKSFERLLLAELWISHCTCFDGIELLEALIDESSLATAEQLNQNFVGNICDILSDRIKRNQSFQRSLPKLLAFSSKGVGNGELLLPLLIKGWKASKKGAKSAIRKHDGELNGKAVEIKNFKSGSMKPAKGGATSKGHIDILNKRLFEGHAPMNSKKGHQKHLGILGKIDKRESYLEYFSKILVKEKSEVAGLVDELLANISDFAKCRSIYGKHVLKAYKEIDGFDIIMLISPENGDMVSIADVDSVPSCIEFVPKMARGSDTQAVPDGYVNIKAKKAKKRRSPFLRL
jgi:hypothetical protein